MKVARNAPCPCGSGRKYKRCHYAEGRDFTFNGDGSVTVRDAIPMDDELAGVMRRQIARFRETFGREPEEGDRLFFDAPTEEEL